MRKNESETEFENDTSVNRNPLIADLEHYSEISLQEILSEMIDGKKNLDLKTHVHRPKELSSLKSIAKYLDVLNFHESSKVLDNFIKYYLRYMISFKRLSRGEIIRAITRGLAEESEENLSKRLITNLNKK